ncbi:MAG TPA: DUF305 domain-containing protein [Gemmatimonadales bacterium]|nr:DUF305 domain-containing protein [Gemmatimonadales bacterium]
MQDRPTAPHRAAPAAPAVLAVLTVLALSACAASAPPEVGPPSPVPSGPSASRQAAVERARADSLRHPYTAADIRFMTGMIGHHAQAIEMSRLVPERTASPSIRTLAGRIINAQQDEIAIMQRWLRDRNQPAPELHLDGGTAMVHGEDHAGMMPGMLTPAQLAELAAAHGGEFDRLFLRDMIQHHRGAVTMVTELFSSWGAGQDETVFKFASDVNVDQSTEIARMEEMLTTLILERGSP